MPRGTIVLSIFDWGYQSHGHSDMQLARAFAAHGPVLFVNSIGMRSRGLGSGRASLQRVVRKLRSVFRRPARAASDVDVTVFTPIFWPIYSGLVGRLNDWSIRSQISRMAARLGFEQPLVIVTLPTFADVALALDRSALVYNRSDRHSDFRFGDQRLIAEKEELLFQHADAVLYANHGLFAAERDRVRGSAVHVGHGIDVDQFAPSGPGAPELHDVPRPRAGFFGDLRAHAVDFALLEAVARLRPDIQIVLGGTQSDDISALHRLPNVHIFGPCPHSRMPARWRSLDVAILPYRHSPWLEVSEPIKLNEIAAIGLPAVGTRLPALIARGVAVADAAEDFADLLSAAVQGNLAPCEAGHLRSWAGIADEIRQHLDCSQHMLAEYA